MQCRAVFVFLQLFSIWYLAFVIWYRLFDICLALFDKYLTALSQSRFPQFWHLSPSEGELDVYVSLFEAARLLA